MKVQILNYRPCRKLQTKFCNPWWIYFKNVMVFSDKGAGLVKESKKIRKRREWMLRKSRKEQGIKPNIAEQRYRGDWAYLPDLVLEEIFQYLGYKVSVWGGGH